MKRLSLLITIGILFWLLYANIASLRTYTSTIDHIIDSFYTKQELKRISTALTYEYIADRTLPTAAQFQTWTRNTLESTTNRKRDRSHDWWGTPYTLTTTHDAFTVASAGPDKTHHTKDDIKIHRTYASIPTTTSNPLPGPAKPTTNLSKIQFDAWGNPIDDGLTPTGPPSTQANKQKRFYGIPLPW